ncbi:HAD-IIB family hydrolase [Mangrovicoccus sp. HB161399]|uniref:HAD-IIB family hydrolase n=1 Tax=Mangrovicoccus sp. HB161399 TaxID=2720392 RepID=UPI001554CDCB|nr:HAD-IIB family hydrolase [Mangrovicoccus sp. HB161399]
MTIQDRVTLPEIAEKTMVLATDLDGTFLGGTPEERRALYDWIEENRDTVGLIFVTGRDPEFIAGLVEAEGTPWPDYAVGDVGTTIAHVSPETGVEPIEELEEQIAEIWGDAGDSVRARLDGWPGLKLQQTPFRYRVSYDLIAGEFDHGAKAAVEEMGHDWLISDNRYFDVLPKGISKGPSLKRLLAHLGISEGRVLAAGDTLNDYSLLTAGVPAVAVGNSEAPLKEALAKGDHPKLHHARKHGCGGIAEAIVHFDLHPTGATAHAK